MMMNSVFFKFNLMAATAADSSGISSIRLIEKCRPSVAKFSSNSSFIYSDVLKAQRLVATLSKNTH
ncbi:hypothetical protein T4D_10781 [Trichinella pseudospiralis]|uniref:Uncharacterized protein n=1 Tax=Trichinella pseudospiralis TaxID=6337 RepID=A0A0V1FKW6_TRIPS|nr:hypothetical protein T4D_10781 [Trichinella pseudospiralis]